MPLTDSERLDFLDWLMTRTEFQNRERPNVPVKSDMHLADWGCSLYARNLTGRVVGTGNGKTVREAIDECAAMLGHNAALTGSDASAACGRSG